MKPCNTMIVASALVVLISNAVVAEDNLLTAADGRKEVQVGSYLPGSTGSQTRVREWDGRHFTGLGIESLSMYGYKGDGQYWFDAKDLTLGNESIFLGMAHRNTLKFKAGTNLITHRHIATPSINPWVAQQRDGLTSPAPVVIGAGWDTVLDFSPGAQLQTENRFNNLDLYWNVDQNQRLGLVTGFWQLTSKGQDQLLFRARQAQPGVIANRTRAAIAWPVDRQTNETSVGGDVALGPNSVVNVRFVDTKFGDHRKDIAAGSDLDFLPLNQTTKIGNETQSRIIKARTKITNNLQFTGVQINRERTSNTNIPTGYNDAGTFMTKKVKLDSTNLGLNFRASDSLSLTGRWRKLSNDNLVPPIFSGENIVPSNLQLSQDTQSIDVEAIFTGIDKAYMRFGYEKREVDRLNSSIHPSEAHLGLPFTSASTDTNIWRGSLRYHPIMPLNISGNYESAKSANSGFTGSPNDRTKSNVNATYMVSDNAAIYGDFSQLKEKNTQIRVAGVIPDAGTDAETVEERELAAGQGYKTDFTTASIGSWLAVSDKLVLDVNYGSVQSESSGMWIIGAESAYLPHLPAQNNLTQANDTQWSAGAHYSLTNKVKLSGGFFHSNSDGASLVDPAKFAGLGPKWTPFEVSQDRWQVGVRYGMSVRDTINLDYSYGNWSDAVDPANNGRFQLYRLAVTRSF